MKQKDSTKHKKTDLMKAKKGKKNMRKKGILDKTGNHTNGLTNTKVGDVAVGGGGGWRRL